MSSVTNKKRESEVPWADIDSGIVKAVRTLCDVGLNTTSSCQGGHAHNRGRPYVIIEPRFGEATGALRVKAARALVAAGFHGFGINIGTDYWYQGSAKLWKTQPHDGRSYLTIEFWNQDNQADG